MSKSIYVFSTLTSGHKYTIYHPKKKDDKSNKPAQKKAQVFIAGGANVIDREHIVTPKGVMTKITEDQLELLEQSPIFKRHVKRGHIQISDKECHNQKEIDALAKSDMNEKDKSAPLTKAEPGMKVSTGTIDGEQELGDE